MVTFSPPLLCEGAAKSIASKAGCLSFVISRVQTKLSHFGGALHKVINDFSYSVLYRTATILTYLASLRWSDL